MNKRADVVIIGAGIMGLSSAYNLAALGVRNICVVEQGYICYGASGRNGGGVRQQWSTRDNIQLMQHSIDICKNFARDMGINIWFRQGGYLFLATEKAQKEQLERNIKVQNECGVGTELLTPQEALKIVPQLNVDGIIAAAYNPEDGIVFPWPFLWGYAEGATRLGVQLYTFTKVTALETSHNRIKAVVTDRGTIETETVINAAGAWSPQVAALAGVELPNHPVRHQILVTEPLKPFLKPMVSLLGPGLYFSQSMRGEIVGGISDPEEPLSLDLSSNLRFLRRMSRAITRLVPILSDVKVLRQWAGPYDITPDGNPILGRVEGVEGFIQLNGFMGHGFMMAPIMGKMIAEWLVSNEHSEIFERYRLSRFESGPVDREDFIIG